MENIQDQFSETLSTPEILRRETRALRSRKRSQSTPRVFPERGLNERAAAVRPPACSPPPLPH